MPEISRFYGINYRLKVTFKCGVIKTYDFKRFFKYEWKNYDELKNITLFNKVKKSRYGHYIYWNKKFNIPCDELWDNGKMIKQL